MFFENLGSVAELRDALIERHNQLLTAASEDTLLDKVYSVTQRLGELGFDVDSSTTLCGVRDVTRFRVGVEVRVARDKIHSCLEAIKGLANEFELVMSPEEFQGSTVFFSLWDEDETLPSGFEVCLD